MKNFKFQIAMAIVCIVLGVMISVQFKTVRSGIGTVSEYRARQLSSELKKVREERDALLNQKSEYEKKIREYENTASQGSNSAKMLKAELDNARILAGLEDVEGPGVTVIVDDLSLSESLGYLLISYTDLLEIVNDLNAAGAEAISINGQRFTARTEIREAGNYININTEKLSAPFVVKAIGNPDTLQGALLIRIGIVERLQKKNVQVTIKQEQNLKIIKYNGILQRQYSKVINEGEKQ